MTPSPPDPIAPGAASQLLALLAAMSGAVLSAGLLLIVFRIRRGRGAAGDATPSRPREEAPSWSRPGPPALRRLFGAVLAALVLLPTAAALRQLWPHPELGARLLVIWLVLLIVAAGACLLGGVGERGGRGCP